MASRRTAAAVARYKPPSALLPADLVEVFDQFEQGDPEWFEVRRGIPTASNFGTIMAEGRDSDGSKSRRALLYRMAGEVLTGLDAETYENDAMRRGKRMEPEARDDYIRTTFEPVRQVAFVRRTIKRRSMSDLVVGCSPDALVGNNHGLEIKSLKPELMLHQLERGLVPAEHRPQVHGTMWVAGLKSLDLKLFFTGMPVSPVFRFERDETYIAQIRNEVERFKYELDQLVAKYENMRRAK